MEWYFMISLGGSLVLLGITVIITIDTMKNKLFSNIITRIRDYLNDDSDYPQDLKSFLNNLNKKSDRI